MSVYAGLILGSGNSGLKRGFTVKILMDMEKLPSENDYPFVFSPALHELSRFSHPYHYMALKQINRNSLLF